MASCGRVVVRGQAICAGREHQCDAKAAPVPSLPPRRACVTKEGEILKIADNEKGGRATPRCV